MMGTTHTVLARGNRLLCDAAIRSDDWCCHGRFLTTLMWRKHAQEAAAAHRRFVRWGSRFGAYGYDVVMEKLSNAAHQYRNFRERKTKFTFRPRKYSPLY